MSIKLMSAIWDLDLPRTETLIMLALADLANDDGYCAPDMTKLARRCRIDRGSLAGWITKLERAGWLTVREGGAYFLNSEKITRVIEATP